MTIVRAEPDAPSLAYFGLIGVWTMGMVGVAWAGASTFREWDARGAIAFTLATHGAARIVSMETITLPLRSPFVSREYDDEGQCTETPRGHGLRRAIGELVTCPHCCSAWAAMGLMAAHLLRPRETRVLVSVLAAAAAANLLHRAFTALGRA